MSLSLLNTELDECFDLDTEYELGEEIAKEEGWYDELEEENSRELAIECMKEFFSKRQYYCGGAIPAKTLFSETNIKRVVCLDMEEGISEIHALLRGQEVPEDAKIVEGLDWEIDYVQRLLNMCASERIPKIFAAGIILIYLDLCKGMTYQEWNIWS